MKKSQLAAQLYTVRDFLKTPDDVAGSMEKIKKIGYDAVQLSGLGPIAEEDLVRYAKDNGLVICATHEGAAKIFDETDSVIERLKKLSCKHTAYPCPAEYTVIDYASTLDLAHALEKSAQKFAEAGMTLSYLSKYLMASSPYSVTAYSCSGRLQTPI